MAIGELADGLTVDLDRVSKKYEGLDGTELAISESQERMAVVLDPKDVPRFCRRPTRRTWRPSRWRRSRKTPAENELAGRFDRRFEPRVLNTNGVTQRAKAKITAVDPAEDYRHLAPKALRDLPVGKAFEENLKRLECAPKRGCPNGSTPASARGPC